MKHKKLKITFAVLICWTIATAITCSILYVYKFNPTKRGKNILWFALTVSWVLINFGTAIHIFSSKRCSDETKAFWLLIILIFAYFGTIFYLFLGQKKQKGFNKGTNSQTILLSAIFQAKKSIKIYTNNFYPSYDTIKALNYAAWKKINVQIIISLNPKKRKQKHQEFNLKKDYEDKISIYLTDRQIEECFIIFDDEKVLFNNANFNYRNMYSEAKFYKTLNIKQFEDTWNYDFRKASQLVFEKTHDGWAKRLKYGIINIFYPFF